MVQKTVPVRLCAPVLLTEPTFLLFPRRGFLLLPGNTFALTGESFIFSRPYKGNKMRRRDRPLLREALGLSRIKGKISCAGGAPSGRNAVRPDTE